MAGALENLAICRGFPGPAVRRQVGRIGPADSNTIRATSAGPYGPAGHLIRGTNMSSVEDQVRGIIAEQLGLKAEEIKNDASFVDDLGADSLDTVELVMALEEEFETEIPDEEAEKITTVQHAIDYIRARQSEA